MFSIAIYILFFELYNGSAFPVDFNSIIFEELPNRFDSQTKTYTFLNNNPQKILKKDILREKVKQELKIFDTMNKELHFARHKNSKNIAIFKRNTSPTIPSVESPETFLEVSPATSLAGSPTTISITFIDLKERVNKRFQEEKVLIPKTHHKLLRDSIRYKEENKDLRDQVTNLKTKVTNLNTNLTTLSRNLQYLVEVVSLCVLRNKIDYQEARYGVGHLEVDELTRLLKIDSIHLKELAGVMHQYVQKRREEEVNNLEMQVLVTQAKQLVDGDLKKLSQMPEDPKMLDSVSIKARKHMLRCKLIFHLYSTDTEVKEMKKVIDTKFDGSIDDACMETGFLVVILSTLGIHILPPSFALRDINAKDIKNGLYHLGFRRAKTMAIVDLFHCGEVDEKYMKSLSSTVSSNKM